MGDFAFDADTRVVASDSSGCFAASLSGRWNGTNGAVNGGYMLAICLRALGLRMQFPDPIVVSGFFLRPGTAGPAEIGTTLTRSGRTTAFGEAVLSQDGKDVARAAARFVSGGYHEEDFEVWDSAGRLVAQSRQLAMILPLGLRVCAYASRLRNRTAPTTSRTAV